MVIEERLRRLERAVDAIQSQIAPMWAAIESDCRADFIACLSSIEIVLGDVKNDRT